MQDKIRDVFRKKRGLCGNISHTRRGGLTHSHLFMFVLPSFFFACQNHPELLKNIFYYFKIFLFWDIFRKKTVFRRKNSHTGGVGVCPRGNYSHIIPKSSQNLSLAFCAIPIKDLSQYHEYLIDAVFYVMMGTEKEIKWNKTGFSNGYKQICQAKVCHCSSRAGKAAQLEWRHLFIVNSSWTRVKASSNFLDPIYTVVAPVYTESLGLHWQKQMH